MRAKTQPGFPKVGPDPGWLGCSLKLFLKAAQQRGKSGLESRMEPGPEGEIAEPGLEGVIQSVVSLPLALIVAGKGKGPPGIYLQRAGNCFGGGEGRADVYSGWFPAPRPDGCEGGGRRGAGRGGKDASHPAVHTTTLLHPCSLIATPGPTYPRHVYRSFDQTFDLGVHDSLSTGSCSSHLYSKRHAKKKKKKTAVHSFSSE